MSQEYSTSIQTNDVRAPVARRHLHAQMIVAGAAVLALFALALWLRWQYVTDVDLYIDEFTTLWASSQVMERGVPLMPSGVPYTRGMLVTYLTAGTGALLGLSPTTGRLPSLFFGIASVAAIFYVGRREWSTSVGWIAALGLALLPEAIEWSGRARFYAELQFFVLLTIWAAYRAIQHPAGDAASWRRHLLFAAAFVLALFSQAEAVLVYGSVIVGILLWRGWRYVLQPAVFVSQTICVAALGLRYAIEQISQAGHLSAASAQKPYLSLTFETMKAWGEYGPLLLNFPSRLPWTVFAIVAVAVAVGYVWNQRGRLRQVPAFHQATLFFAVQYLFTLLVLLTVAADAWREDRYLFMVQPAWLLVGAAGLVWTIERLVSRRTIQVVAVGMASVLLLGAMRESAFAVLTLQPDGYEPVLNYVATHRQPGDLVMSPQPAACALMLGEPCDYYARQEGYEPYVVRQREQWVDRWSGAPLLSTPEQLEELLQAGNRVWFVTDGHRLGARYEDRFVRTVVEQFDVTYTERRVRALMADGWRDPPAYTVEQTPMPAPTIDRLALVEWMRTEPQPGRDLHVLLGWQATEFIGRQINTALHVVAADGSRPTQADGPPARDMIFTFERPHVVLPDPKTVSLPADLAPGRYRLEVIGYDVHTQEVLADPVLLDWFRVGPAPAPPQQDVGASWVNGLTLVGHDGLPAALAPDTPLSFRLVWTTADSVSQDYTVFLHLVGPDGSIVAQSDQVPTGGFYPTSGWKIDDRIGETYSLQMPVDLPAGDYRLVAGWYQPASGERVLLENGADTLELARWHLD